MPRCPICKTVYRERETNRCHICKWHLTPYLFALSGQAIAVFLQKEKEKQEWARTLWAQLQAQTAEFEQQRAQFQLKLERVEREKAQLQSQLEQALFQLKRANRERSPLQSQSESFTGEKISQPSQTDGKAKPSNERAVSLSGCQGEPIMPSQVSRSANVQRHPPNCIVRSETNQRDNNEDSFQILEIVPTFGRSPVTVLAVADGMGGHAYGEEVSREALRKVSLALFEHLAVEPSLNRLQPALAADFKTVSQALINALEVANAHIQRMVKANKWGNAGSTIVVAAILEDTAVVAYLGDSPMFHYQTRYRKLVKVTEDHTVAGVLLRAGMITPEMARYHEGRSRLEFYVGCSNLPREAPVHQIALTPGDVLLLCSDGVSGSLAEEQIAKILAESGGNLALAAEHLLQIARQAGETDNQTLILWRHSSSEASVSDVEEQERSRDRVRDFEQVKGSAFKTIQQQDAGASESADSQQQQGSQYRHPPIDKWNLSETAGTASDSFGRDSSPQQFSENSQRQTLPTRRNP